MILTDQKVINLLNHKASSSQSEIRVDNLEGMIFNKMCLGLITVSPFIFKNIQFLSLENNFLSDISFLKHLSNLYFFDISKNSIEDLEPLNTKSTFGYLRLTLGQFRDKKLLTLKGMTIGIFEVEMQDYSLFPQFLRSNSNIIVLNKEIIYFREQILPQEETRCSKKIKTASIQKPFNPQNQFPSANISDSHFNSTSRLLTINSSSTNTEINKLTQFYNQYNAALYSIISKLDCPSSKILSVDKTYQDLERTKLKLLANEYFYINQLASRQGAFLMNKGHMSDIHFFNFTKLQTKDIQNQLIILILLLLYLLQMITKELAITALNYILKHFNAISDKELLQSDSFSYCHLLGIYYYIYDGFVESYDIKKHTHQRDCPSNDNSSISFSHHRNIKYDKIIETLKMDSLTLKGNYLSQINNEASRNKCNSISNNKKKSNLGIESGSKRLSVKWKYDVLKELKLADPVLFLIQFLFDYIYSSKIDRILSDAFFDDYVSLNETRDYLYKFSSEKLCFTLSEKKFRENKFNHLSNRLFLSKEYSNNKERMYLNGDTILTNKTTKFYINNHPAPPNDAPVIESNNKSIFDNLHMLNRKLKPKVTIEVRGDASDEADDKHKDDKEELDPKLYLNVKKISQLNSNKHCNKDVMALNMCHMTNTVISSYILPKVDLRDMTNSIATMLTPSNKANSQMPLWRNYKSNAIQLRQQQKQTYKKTINEIDTDTTLRHKINKSMNIPLTTPTITTTTTMRHHKTQSSKFQLKKRHISQSKDMNYNSNNKSRNANNSITSKEGVSPTPEKNRLRTTANFFHNAYHPIFTQTKIKKKINGKKKRRTKNHNHNAIESPSQLFMTNMELRSFLSIRKYNENG